jgi:hypothetical protein
VHPDMDRTFDSSAISIALYIALINEIDCCMEKTFSITIHHVLFCAFVPMRRRIDFLSRKIEREIDP